MTGTQTVTREQEMKPLVRYQLQARPEKTRLLIDFNQSQHELLEHVISLLLHRNKENDNGREAADGSSEKILAVGECTQSRR